MAMIKNLRAAVALLPCLLFAAAAPAQQYTIKLNHAEKVGDTMPLVADGKETQGITTTIPGQAPNHSDQPFDAQLTGERKVLAVNEKGNPTKLSITVSKCTSGGQPVVPPGSVVTAERTGAALASYLIDGKPADDAAARVMALVIDLNDPTEPDMDATFGTTKPQKPGDSWPINVDEAMKAASQAGFTLKKENVSGTTTLAGVEKIDGKDVLRVKGSITARNLSGPGPGGITIQSGELTMNFDGLIRADDATVPLRQGQQMSVHIVSQAPIPNGGSATMELKMDHSLSIRMGAGAKPDAAK